MFNSTGKFLAESFSSDYVFWLLGEPIPVTELISPSKLLLKPIRADALMLLPSEEYVSALSIQGFY